MKRLSLLISAMAFGFMVLITSAPHAKAADINVPDDYTTIQEAIDASVEGDVVIVGVGTYVENINFLGKAITVRGTDPNDPDVVAATIIDGNQVDTVVTFNNGEDLNSILNGFTVRNGRATSSGGINCTSSSPTIANCNITKNSAISSCPDDKKVGGISCTSSSPDIINCNISENLASKVGGISCTNNSAPTITNCIIAGNKAAWGGIFCYDSSSPTINNCIIKENYGLGIYSLGSSPIITNCTISEQIEREHGLGSGEGFRCSGGSSIKITNCIINGNSSYGIICTDSSPLIISNCTISKNNGTGISCWNSSPIITNCIIAQNLADIGGGICCRDDSSPTITNCIIAQNSADKGGGIYCRDDSSPTITNCIIAQNSTNKGGGIYCLGGISGGLVVDPTWPAIYWDFIRSFIPRPKISNCTITENFASEAGGGIYSQASYPIITNCIIWSNLPDEIKGFIIQPRIAYSDVQKDRWRCPGRGNINADPLFVDPEAGDYRLQPSSP